MEVAIRVEAAGPNGDDRAAAFPFAGGHLLVIADGAGGSSGGGAAAQEVVDAVRALDPAREHDWVQVLARLDTHLSSSRSLGETTAVVAFLANDKIVGASVGDSGGWVRAGHWFDLLENQRRKPLLGSGAAVPVSFGPFPMVDRVLLASDGLFKYVAADVVDVLASNPSLDQAASELVQAARLPSGGLQDDIAVIIAGYGGEAPSSDGAPGRASQVDAGDERI